jgi:hypothetical protein
MAGSFRRYQFSFERPRQYCFINNRPLAPVLELTVGYLFLNIAEACEGANGH